MEKLNGKERNSNMLPAAAGAEGRAARKFAELEAGRVLVAQAAKQMEESREKLEEERLEKKEKEREDRDTPELSRQSKWFGVEGKQMEEDFQWTLEMEKELWEAFQSWQPKPDGNLSGDLASLSRMYLALLEAVLTHTTGEEQMLETARLDEVLMEKLNLLLEVRLKHLLALLVQTGQRETFQSIWSSLYKRSAGENPDPKASERIFLKYTAGMEGEAGTGKTQTGAVFAGSSPIQGESGFRQASLEEGRLYRPSGGGGIEMNQAFDMQRRSGELQLSQRASVLSGRDGQGDGSLSVSDSELCRADAFAAHLSESSRLFADFQKSGGNEDAAGYFAALTFIKGQMYASGGNAPGEMVLPMESLVNRLVDFYLSSKGARQVYYYTMDIYQRTSDSQKAAREGLSYAFQMFQKKKEDPAYEDRPGYSKESGFFQRLNGRTLEEDFQAGARLLEESFRSFLRSQGDEEQERMTLRAQRSSPWGMLAESEKRRKEQEKKADQALLRTALLAAAAGLLFLGWKFFLG